MSESVVKDYRSVAERDLSELDHDHFMTVGLDGPASSMSHMPLQGSSGTPVQPLEDAKPGDSTPLRDEDWKKLCVKVC